MSTVIESIDISARPETVYDLVADVAGIGRFSPEATGALGAGPQPGVGDAFWGVNRRGVWVWVTRCTVTGADRGRFFAFEVDFGPLPVSAWTYEIVATDDGCRVAETWVDRREGVRGMVMKALGKPVIPESRSDHNRATMRATLIALKQTAEELAWQDR